MGEVGFIHSNLNPLGIVGDQTGGVDDTAVVLAVFPGSEDKQTVTKFEHGVVVQLRCRCVIGSRQNGFCQSVRNGIQLGQLAFLQSGTDGHAGIQNIHILALAEHTPHQIAGSGCPGAVFQQGNGAVLQIVGHQIAEQSLHADENAGIVGGGREDQMAVPECGGHDVGSGGHGNVENPGLDTLFSQLDRQNFHSVFGVAVDGGVGDHHTGLFRCIGCPMEIFVDEIADVLPPHEAVQGADHLDIQHGGLGQQGSDLLAVFAHNIGIVTPCFIQIIPVEVHLVSKQCTVQSTEGAEGIGGEQNAVGGVEGYHNLGPVDHRGFYKAKIVTAGGENFPFLGLHPAAVHIKVKKLLDHVPGGHVADDLHLGITQYQILQNGGMVRLHVVDKYIVQFAAIQHSGHIFKKHLGDRLVNGIEQDGLFVQQDIGVVGNAVRHGIHALKHGQPPVIGTDPEKIVLNFSVIIHIVSPFIVHLEST